MKSKGKIYHRKKRAQFKERIEYQNTKIEEKNKGEYEMKTNGILLKKNEVKLKEGYGKA